MLVGVGGGTVSVRVAVGGRPVRVMVGEGVARIFRVGLKVPVSVMARVGTKRGVAVGNGICVGVGMSRMLGKDRSVWVGTDVAATRVGELLSLTVTVGKTRGVSTVREASMRGFNIRLAIPRTYRTNTAALRTPNRLYKNCCR